MRALGMIASATLFATIAGCVGAQARTLEGAAWSATTTRPKSTGIRILDGADGYHLLVTKGKSRCAANKPGTTPASTYLYFAIDGARKAAVRGAVYVAVEYYDDSLGGMVTLEYDSKDGDSIPARYRHAEARAGGWTLGAHAWRTAYFELRQPRFGGRQNLGADFRLSGTRLYIRSLRLTTKRPADWAKRSVMPRVHITPKVKIGSGGQLIIGGFDPARASDVPSMTAALEAMVPGLKSIGVTSHEGYVRWNLCEPEEGTYDWSVYDAFVRIYKAHGLKWVPFLIIGSAYSLPDWYYKKPGSQGYVCLEHGQESDVDSLWNPVLKKHVARFIKAFCERYRDQGVIETILLGVTGNYGEAIYVVTGNDWTADIHGPYHTHPGYWAGDPYAIESFRAWLIHKYGGFDRLRDAWGTGAGSIGEIRPFLKQNAPNERAWLDMCDWYIGSMTEWSRWWLQETRRHFPKGDIQLCTGGHAPPEHGSDFGMQCKIAAEIGGGVRITNEASDYASNYAVTRWVASAARQYGARYSFEPAGDVNAQGVVVRVYNATASGANGLHYYFPNLFGADANRASFEKWGSEFRQRKPVVEIAVYYPQTHVKLNGNDFLDYVRPLRERFDYEYMSDGQILDGGLKRVKALILMHGSISEAAVWSRIAEWVEAGGLLLYADGMGRLRSVEGDDSWHDRIVRPQGKGRSVVFKGLGNTGDFRDFAAKTLADAPELSAGTRAMVTEDGRDDRVFATLLEGNRLLWLNATDQPVSRSGRILPPWSIVETPATGN